MKFRLYHSSKSNNSRILTNYFLIQKLKKLVNISLESSSAVNFNSRISEKKLSTKWIQYFFFKKPINLLFSIDQFLYEFSKKQPQRKKYSEFQLQLKERKKLTLFYGHISKKQLLNIMQLSRSSKGYFSKNFFSLLERRLDVVLYRSNFAKTITQAKQFINHKKILVNNKTITKPSYQVNSGDIISIRQQDFSVIGTDMVKSIQTHFKKRSSQFPPVSTLFTKVNALKKKKLPYSKKLLDLLILLVTKKIQTRAYFKIFKNVSPEITSLPANLRTRILSSIHWNTSEISTYLTFLKIKPLISKKSKLLLFSYKKQDGFSFQKTPLIQTHVNKFQKKTYYLKDINKLTESKFAKKSLLSEIFYENNIEKKILSFYRNFYIQLIAQIHFHKDFESVFLLKLKKNLKKKRSRRQVRTALRLYGVKPLNLEISYNLLTFIYLYSPQRLYFPFYIDVDLILRSFR